MLGVLILSMYTINVTPNVFHFNKQFLFSFFLIGQKNIPDVSLR